jgi:hypothetical protein
MKDLGRSVLRTSSNADECCKFQKEVLQVPEGVAKSTLELKECDLAIEMFQIQIEW